MSQTTPNAQKLTQRDLIKARMRHIRWWLDSVLKRLTPELIEWAPAEGMRSVAGQLVEIISVEMCLVPRLREGRQLTDEEIEAAIGDQSQLDHLLQLLVDVRRSTLEYLDSLSDEELSEEIVSGQAWFGTLWLPSMPRAVHFLNIAEHEFYHAGQLISYVWTRGDDPFQW